jgi:hypothetical protein
MIWFRVVVTRKVNDSQDSRANVARPGGFNPLANVFCQNVPMTVVSASTADPTKSEFYCLFDVRVSALSSGLSSNIDCIPVGVLTS